MDDLVKRLRHYADQDARGSTLLPPEGLVEEAADLIEAQTAQLQEAREIIASQLEALEEFGISGGAMPEARAFLAK
jgi:hypothetical protein